MIIVYWIVGCIIGFAALLGIAALSLAYYVYKQMDDFELEIDKDELIHKNFMDTTPSYFYEMEAVKEVSLKINMNNNNNLIFVFKEKYFDINDVIRIRENGLCNKYQLLEKVDDSVFSFIVKEISTEFNIKFGSEYIGSFTYNVMPE